eukprot:4307834-Lingulodinium_polyedra.AAC.1
MAVETARGCARTYAPARAAAAIVQGPMSQQCATQAGAYACSRQGPMLPAYETAQVVQEAIANATCRGICPSTFGTSGIISGHERRHWSMDL